MKTQIQGAYTYMKQKKRKGLEQISEPKTNYEEA